jgi:hypothetical protein
MEFKNVLTIALGVAGGLVLLVLLKKVLRPVIPVPPEIVEIEKPKELMF